MTVYFHTTGAADAILRDGFRDPEGTGFQIGGETLVGVFLADVPVDVNEGAKGDELLEVQLPDGLDLSDYEIVQEELTYREWCVPAAVVNEHARVRLLVDGERDEAEAQRWLRVTRHQDDRA